MYYCVTRSVGRRAKGRRAHRSQRTMASRNPDPVSQTFRCLARTEERECGMGALRGAFATVALPLWFQRFRR
jgi:hypothetical protein